MHMFAVLTFVVFLAAIKCPKLDDIPNGGVQLNGNTLNSIAKYTCSEGYTIEGFQQRRCDEEGTWEGSPPTCHRTSKRKLLTCS